jgi:hypothetical protein
MNLDELEKLGGIVSAELVKHEVTLVFENENGEAEEKPFAVFIKRLAVSDYEDLATVLESAPKKDKKRRQCALISVAASLGENGEIEIPYEKARRIDADLSTQIIARINQVNSKKKLSRQVTNSGTN